MENKTLTSNGLRLNIQHWIHLKPNIYKEVKKKSLSSADPSGYQLLSAVIKSNEASLQSQPSPSLMQTKKNCISQYSNVHSLSFVSLSPDRHSGLLVFSPSFTLPFPLVLIFSTVPPNFGQKPSKVAEQSILWDESRKAHLWDISHSRTHIHSPYLDQFSSHVLSSCKFLYRSGLYETSLFKKWPQMCIQFFF